MEMAVLAANDLLGEADFYHVDAAVHMPQSRSRGNVFTAAAVGPHIRSANGRFLYTHNRGAGEGFGLGLFNQPKSMIGIVC